MPIKINGSTSGSTTITAPATGTDETIELSTALAAKAPLASPALTGTPTLGGTAITALAGLQLVTPTSVAGTGVSLSGSTVNFTGASAVSVNGCFTSTFSHYRIVVDISAASVANAQITARLRAAGSDTAGTNYRTGETYQTGATVGGRTNYTGTDDWFIGLADSTYPQSYSLVMDLADPQAAVYTKGTGQATTISSVGDLYGWGFAWCFVGATQFDGFSIIPASGTVGGSLRVYGYRNA